MTNTTIVIQRQSWTQAFAAKSESLFAKAFADNDLMLTQDSAELSYDRCVNHNTSSN